jgi:leucyl/phenylalanyl-tRNA--protein transferase
MFSRATDASKIALAHLCRFLATREFGIIDCQMETAHLASLGARPIARDEFIARISSLTATATPAAHWDAASIDGIFRNPCE